MRIKTAKILLPLLLLIFTGLSFAPIIASAQNTPTLTAAERCARFKAQFNVGGANPFDWVTGEYCTASGILIKAISLAIMLAGSVAVIFIILGGYQLVISGGNEEMSEKGKKTLTNAVIGLVIIIMAFVIVRVISNTLTGNLGATTTTTTTTGSQTSNTSNATQPPPQTPQFGGSNTAVLGNQYYFTLTTNKAYLDGACNGSEYAAYVKAGASNDATANSTLNSVFSAQDNGAYVANFYIDPNTLQFSDSQTNGVMVLAGYVCGQYVGSKSVGIQPGSTPVRGGR